MPVEMPPKQIIAVGPDPRWPITTSAEVVCDSVSPAGVRLTTIEVTFARFVLAELNTHRVFSRNSASSRAIPARKQIRRVVDDPFVPLVWASERPGMQGGDELTGWRRSAAKVAWRAASLGAAGMARAMVGLGVHKSIANRLIEPFAWHTAVVTATDWDGFFEQRCSPLAQPELRVAAESMRAALEASTPTSLRRDDWHLPYITDAGASCGANFNGLGADAGITIVEGHEMSESITDQFPSGGWLDSSGYETGDKCAWISSGQGASANVTFPDGKTFPVQSLWSNAFNNDAGGCVLSY